jgi:hypothetical protein
MQVCTALLGAARACAVLKLPLVSKRMTALPVGLGPALPSTCQHVVRMSVACKPYLMMVCRSCTVRARPSRLLLKAPDSSA